MKTNLAWHFVGVILRDGSPIPADGEWLAYSGPCKKGESGLHASRNPFDALQYAPGDTLCLVEIADIVEDEADNLLCRKRKIIVRMDATEMLRYFARMQAVSCLAQWKYEPDQIILDWLMTGDPAAYDAARAAAYATARAATHDVAYAAARAAAYAAARAVAYAAARAATRVAARDAAYAAAHDAAKNEFTQLVHECFESFL